MQTDPTTRAVTAGNSFSYVPGLDGLRGVSVLLVIAFHAGVPFLRGGYLGVDVFFVVSGFLITSILLKEHQRTGRISLGRFYLRRALRLLPALFLLLLAFLAFTLLVLPYNRIEENLIDILVTLFYSQNWTRAYQFTRPGWLSHTWSLSIEEQFYIIYPVFLILLLRWSSGRQWVVGGIIAGLALGLFAWSAWRAESVPWTILYLGLETRGASLLLGCVLGVITSVIDAERIARVRTPLSYLSLIAVGFLVYSSVMGRLTDPGMYRYGSLLIAISSAVVILTVVSAPDSLVSAVLRRPFLIWVGRISYGLYLWHHPIFHLRICNDQSWPAKITIGGLISFAVASLSYYLVERRFLTMKTRYQTSPERESPGKMGKFPPPRVRPKAPAAAV